MDSWFVYIVECCDNTLYTGIAKDLQRRTVEHNENDRLGARYTRARRPVALVYQEVCENRSIASKREYQIKSLSRSEKQQLIRESSILTP